jgi:hypothetical protein
MKSGVLLKKMLVFSPAIIPFSGLPLFGIAGIHLTVSRAYLVVVFLVYLMRMIHHRSLPLPSNKSILIFFLLWAYGVLLLLSGFWAEDVARAIDYNIFYFWYIFFIWVFLSARLDNKDLEKFYDVWVLTAGLIALMCFIEVTFEVRYPGSRYLAEESLGFFIPTATFHNENNLAIYLALSSVFALAKADASDLMIRWMVYFSLVWSLYVILLTFSRGGLLVFVIGVFLYLLMNAKISVRKLLRSGLIFISLVSLVAYFGLIDSIVDTFVQVSDALGKDDARYKLLQHSLSAMQENYCLGVGAGGIESYMSQFNNVRVLAVHNWLGEVLANTGVIGGAIWGIRFYLLIIFGRRSSSQSLIYSSSVLIVFFLFPLWQSIVSSMIQFSAFWFFMAAFIMQIDARLNTKYA